MTTTTHPSKESVRAYLERRWSEEDAPPDMDEIRRQLGWGLIVPDPDKPQERRSTI